MAKERLTPWFSARTKPVRAGYYEVLYRDQGENTSRPDRRHFDGCEWRSPYGALYGFGNVEKDLDYEFWRGLAKQPKARQS